MKAAISLFAFAIVGLLFAPSLSAQEAVAAPAKAKMTKETKAAKMEGKSEAKEAKAMTKESKTMAKESAKEGKEMMKSEQKEAKAASKGASATGVENRSTKASEGMQKGKAKPVE